MSEAQERVAGLVSQFVDGWYERVEYNKPVQVHTEVCRSLRMKCPPGRLKHYRCRCQVRLEPRTDRVRQAPLLVQLFEAQSGYSPVAMGGRYGKPGSRPPAPLDMLDLVNVIKNWLDGVGIPPGPLPERLRALVSACGGMDGVEAHRVAEKLSRYVRSARIVLQYDVPKRALRDTVCGECGSTLVVATDAGSDVKCTGEDCGTVYRRYEWIDLLEN